MPSLCSAMAAARPPMPAPLIPILRGIFPADRCVVFKNELNVHKNIWARGVSVNSGGTLGDAVVIVLSGRGCFAGVAGESLFGRAPKVTKKRVACAAGNQFHGVGGSGGGDFRLGVGARSALLRYVSQWRCLRSPTIGQSQ
ncbi:protein of unknown function [Cupriavidus taiwanensis]|nr:protein of unknown function [Cupriavidus taiwanensis]